jgi:glycosyltransferase involved in cell wall biosynthesis
MDNRLITICIPTFRRPDLLLEAIQTCVQQDHRPLEILIGDDSMDQNSFELTRGLALPSGVTLRHVVHPTSLKQARNVSWLFSNASGSRLSLIHDDDGFLPHGLDKLVAAWDTAPNVVCAYGKFEIVSAEGALLPDDTSRHNALYGRVSSAAGLQESALTAGLSQQFPHNGYLVATELARTVKYRTEQEVGNSGDVDFGIRLAIAAGRGKFFFVDEFISFYRQTANSILRTRRGNYGHHLLYEKMLQLPVPPQDRAAHDLLLRRMSALAVLSAAMAGQRKQAVSIMCSKHYSLRYTDVRTAFRLAYIASPRLGDMLNDLLPASR